MNKPALRLTGILVLVLPLAVQTQSATGATGGSVTYRCVDSAGRSTYTNVKEEMSGKTCTVVSREVSVVPAQRPAVPQPPPAVVPGKPAAKPGGTTAPRVDAQTQRSRDNDRRRILEAELQSAEKQLAEARQRLAHQESIRSGDEKNYQRVLDRLKPYQEEVRRAEENVAALRRELGKLR